jgi:phage tail protein X
MNTYRTIQGDTWDSIAARLYGSEKHMIALMTANPGFVEVVIFSAGVELRLPEIVAGAAASLPPWKRGGVP